MVLCPSQAGVAEERGRRNRSQSEGCAGRAGVPGAGGAARPGDDEEERRPRRLEGDGGQGVVPAGAGEEHLL